MQNHSLVSLSLACVTFMLTGCAATNIFKFGGDQFPKSGPNNPVVRILGLWQPMQGPGLQNETARGIGGQILFFDKNDEAPAQVDGDVMIYVFDDEGSEEEQARPIHQFHFSPGAWNTHLYKGSLGATYDIFVPYTRPGVQEAKCAIRVRYTPKGGIPVYSEMVNVILPGRKKPKQSKSADNEYDADEGAAESAEETAAGDRGAVREPPHVRGIAQTIPGLEEVEKLRARRQKPVELTEEERERILREVKARMASEEKRDTHLVSYEERDSKPVRNAKKPLRRRPARNPLLEDDDDVAGHPLQQTEENDAAGDPDNAEDGFEPSRRRHSPGRGRLLDDDTDELEKPAGDPAASSVPGSRQRLHRHAENHLLDDERDE